jgi:hypothetical protein
VEAEDRPVDATGCFRLFYPYFAVFFVLGHKGSLVSSFSINGTPRASGEANTQPSLSHPPSHSSFLGGVDVLHGVSEERRESERSLQSSQEWEDVVVVFTPCRYLITSI